MSYADKTGRGPDFRVRYRWCEEQGQEPVQHMRCDFSYAGDDIGRDGVYMVWPEFEDSSGQPVPAGDAVARSGTAGMWIVSAELRRTVHGLRASPGTRGYLVLGSRRITSVEIIELCTLHED